MLQSKGHALFQYPSWMGGRLDWLTPQLSGMVFFIAVAISTLYLGIKIETEATVAIEAQKGNNQNDHFTGIV
ncbi:MAG: hypothetical protein NVS9B13_04880 [Candidatus Acidiferrum sp.]